MGENRLDFGKFIDKAFWALITASVIFAANELKSIGNNVSELNEKMAVVLTRLSDTDRRTEQIEHRIHDLEKIIRE